VRVTFNNTSYEVLTDSTGVWAVNPDTALASGTPTSSVAVRVSGTGFAGGSGTVLTNTNAKGTAYTLTAMEVDAAGNISPAATQNLVYDNMAPTNPTIDAGMVLTSGNTAPLISGTGEAGALITLVVGGATYQTTVLSNGRWSVATATETPISGAYVAPPSGGSVDAYVRQTDAAGNINLGSTSPTVTNWIVKQTYVYDNTYGSKVSSWISSGASGITAKQTNATYQPTLYLTDWGQRVLNTSNTYLATDKLVAFGIGNQSRALVTAVQSTNWSGSYLDFSGFFTQTQVEERGKPRG